jgi:hypothetical protein
VRSKPTTLTVDCGRIGHIDGRVGLLHIIVVHNLHNKYRSEKGQIEAGAEAEQGEGEARAEDKSTSKVSHGDPGHIASSLTVTLSTVPCHIFRRRKHSEEEEEEEGEQEEACIIVSTRIDIRAHIRSAHSRIQAAYLSLSRCSVHCHIQPTSRKIHQLLLLLRLLSVFETSDKTVSVAPAYRVGSGPGGNR